MKKLFIIISLSCVLFSCGGNSGGGDSNGEAPTLNNVVPMLYDPMAGYSQVSSVAKGDSFYLKITATDNDLDITSFEINFYFLPTGELVSGPDLIDAPSQANQTAEWILMYSEIPLSTQSGHYTVSTQVIDENGNRSRIFSFNTQVQ